VDASSLGLQGTDVLGGTVGGVDFSAGTGGRLDDPGSTFLDSNSTQTYTFNYTDSNGNAQSRTVTLTGSTSGIDGTSVIDQLNNGLAGTGVTASIDSSNGDVQFSSSGAFTAAVGAVSGGGHSTATGGPIVNTAQYNVNSAAFAGAGPPATLGAADTFTLSNGTDTANISLLATDTVASAVTKINSALRTAGISDVSAIATGDGTAVSFQGSVNFSIVDTSAASGGASKMFTTAGDVSVAGPAGGTSSSTDAQNAINMIATAIQNLGLVQGRVGAGENQLNYAVGLAQSQITNVSTAEGEIKDTDVATQASDLTKDQVLEQTAVAALAQANSMPEAVLKLLQ
jgi:flagellin